MHVSNLMLELTRRCQLECAHCLRGDVQDKDMSDDILVNILSKFDSIGELTLTGGEPTLYNLSRLADIIEYYRIDLQGFYMATNGIHLTLDNLRALARLYKICEEKEYFCVAISNDAYHNSERMNDPDILFNALAFVSYRNTDHILVKGIGRALLNGLAEEELNATVIPTNIEELNDQTVCFSVHGKYSFEVDISFEDLDKAAIGDIDHYINFVNTLPEE